MKSERRAWIWPFLIAISIICASGTSRLAVPEIDFSISKDKIGHFFIFGLLATTILRIPKIRSMKWRGALLAALLTSLFGAFDELRQSFTPGREVEFADWIADTAGAIVATQVYFFWSGYRGFLEFKIPRIQSKPLKGDSKETE